MSSRPPRRTSPLDEALEIAARTFQVEAVGGPGSRQRARPDVPAARCRRPADRGHEGLQRRRGPRRCSTWRRSPSSTPRASTRACRWRSPAPSLAPTTRSGRPWIGPTAAMPCGCTTSCPATDDPIRATCPMRRSSRGARPRPVSARRLRGFFHARARRTMLWDIQHAERTRELSGSIRGRGAASARRGRLRALRVDGRTGLAVAPRAGRPHRPDDRQRARRRRRPHHRHRRLRGHEPLRADGRPGGRARIAGGRPWPGRAVPLRPTDRRRLPARPAARAARAPPPRRAARDARRGDHHDLVVAGGPRPRGTGFATRYNASVAETIATILDVGWDETARRFGAEVPLGRVDRRRSSARRRAALGPALESLSYDEPIRMVEAHGVWMTDVDGRRYLDAYNNVPVVGHGHPRVTEAIARQARRLNTNLRYLHDTSIELAERLIATCPPGLDTVFFVNSGSEANDLAWRLATTATGRRGGLCTDFAYHGISEAIAAVTPETWPGGRAPEHVATWHAARTSGAGRTSTGPASRPRSTALEARGIPPAAVILDGLLTSDGYPTVDPDLAETWLGAARRAGALWIADEVQGGHGRTGDRPVVVPAPGPDPGHRHDRQADGQRPPGRGGHHATRDRRGVRGRDRLLQHVRRATRWPWPPPSRSSTSSTTSGSSSARRRRPVARSRTPSPRRRAATRASSTSAAWAWRSASNAWTGRPRARSRKGSARAACWSARADGPGTS